MLTVREVAVCDTTGVKMMMAANATALRSVDTRGGGQQSASGLSASVVQRISERGARTTTPARVPRRGPRLARRDDRGYREYLREEQRSQPGCPARKALYK